VRARHELCELQMQVVLRSFDGYGLAVPVSKRLRTIWLTSSA